jgi:hypothetical protein
MADDVERVSDGHVPPAVVHRVDEMIERALRELDALVCLRAELTGEDPFGDRRRSQEAEAELRRRVAEATARDPQRSAEVRSWTRDLLERRRRECGEEDEGPPSTVRLATDMVRQWRQLQRDEAAARRALVDQVLGRRRDGGAGV